MSLPANVVADSPHAVDTLDPKNLPPVVENIPLP